MWLTNFALLIFQMDLIDHVVQRLFPTSVRENPLIEAKTHAYARCFLTSFLMKKYSIVQYIYHKYIPYTKYSLS
jgi:hypothetical protein